MQSRNPDVKEGAYRIITKNMGLRTGEDLVILVDESTSRIAKVLADAARNCGVRSTVITISQKDQPYLSTDHNIPLPLARAIDAAQAVIISLSDNPEGTGFRRHLLEMSRGMRTKVALMPGVTLDMIANITHIDYDILLSYSEFLQLPLLIGRRVSIETNNNEGQTKELHFEIGGWNQPPTISSGIIHSQSFDNIPSGEVYVAPIKGTANGEIVINGSVTGYVFNEGDEVVLKFVDGALLAVTPNDHPVAIFIQEALAIARTQGDKEPEFLAELGIGVSSMSTRLTGNTLEDEKMLGTAHIAIGLNKPFGGNVDAQHIHEDMIFKTATISIDGKPLMKDGKIILDENNWRCSFHDVIDPTPYNHPELVLYTTGVDTEVKNSNLLYRRYYDGTDAPALVKVGDDETAFLATKVYKKLLERGNMGIRIERLSQLTGLSLEQIGPVLYLMGEVFDLINTA